MFKKLFANISIHSQKLISRLKKNKTKKKYVEFVTYSELDEELSAYKVVTNAQKTVLASLMFALIVGFAWNWHLAVMVVIAGLSLIYFLDLVFNLFLISTSYFKPPEIQVTRQELSAVSTRVWPKYTILCPLYREWQVLNQFVTAMENIDYPSEKLEVLLLLEEDDKKTIQAAKKMNLSSIFKVLVVPNSEPKTKPKACNYGLQVAKGEYVVIFDAEDIPEPDQLKKVVLAFEKTNSNTACIQAKLNFYNPRQNIITRLFTLEYSLWFDLVLTGLQAINAPIPLGGTSNHFRTMQLTRLSGWDAFNVTEDADLGVRLAKKGWRTAIVDSVTMEEANSQVVNWIKQRSRWIKGYMQTYLVHMRKPFQLGKNYEFKDVLSFQLITGAKILSMLINPLMWLMTISYFVNRLVVGELIESLFWTPVFYMATLSLVFGNFIYFYNYMLAAAKRQEWDLVKYVFLIPFYWLFMSIACVYSFYELIVRPYHWNKTVHGLHIKKKVKQKNRFSLSFLSRMFNPARAREQFGFAYSRSPFAS